MTKLDKLLTERIIQRTDYGELISNQHRTINGYIQVKELINLCDYTIVRSKTAFTLKVIFEECKSQYIKQNISNDIIIKKYFTDLRKFILDYDFDKKIFSNGSHLVNQNEISILKYHLQIYEAQLEKNYYKLLSKELLTFDTANKEKEFERRADQISTLLDLLISFLVFKGYSLSSMYEMLNKWLYMKYRPTAQRILQFFDLSEKKFNFMLCLGDENDKEIKDFVSMLKEVYAEDSFTIIGKEAMQSFAKQYSIKDNEIVAVYKTSTIDPHSQVRNSYDSLIKKVVIQEERKSLYAFNEFFDRSYWSHGANGVNSFQRINLKSDPINVNGRKSTLRETLKYCSLEYDYKFDSLKRIDVTKNPQLNNAIFYYNLALGSKSIENSLSLLWTAMESIIPYRTRNSDIESVQDIVVLL